MEGDALMAEDGSMEGDALLMVDESMVGGALIARGGSVEGGTLISRGGSMEGGASIARGGSKKRGVLVDEGTLGTNLRVIYLLKVKMRWIGKLLAFLSVLLTSGPSQMLTISLLYMTWLQPIILIALQSVRPGSHPKPHLLNCRPSCHQDMR